VKFPTFTDNEYVKKYDFTTDEGRMAVTNKEADKHMWKVPTLRNIALTAPYFHNGSVKTLDEAVRVMAKVQLDQDLSDTQVADLTAFLHALTGEFPQQPLPHLPPTPGRSIVN
jgi:cytochrome c peroxidase